MAIPEGVKGWGTYGNRPVDDAGHPLFEPDPTREAVTGVAVLVPVRRLTLDEQRVLRVSQTEDVLGAVSTELHAAGAELVHVGQETDDFDLHDRCLRLAVRLATLRREVCAVQAEVKEIRLGIDLKR